MNTLKEINGKYYQEHQVIILHTWDTTHLFLWERVELVDYLVYTPNKYDTKVANYKGNFQHLYILSDDEIQEGDWLMLNSKKVIRCNKKIGKHIYYVSNSGGLATNIDYCKKIIATTDKSLKIESELDAYYRNGIGEARNLPQPSDSFIKKFIEEYNQGNQIKKVFVEYEKSYGLVQKGLPGFPEDDISWWYDKLKVDSNNQVTLKKVEPELYTREQVEKLLIDLWAADLNKRQEIEDWIKENL